MASKPAFPTAIPGRDRAPWRERAEVAATSVPAAAVLLAGLVALSLVLRTQALAPSLWIDEGLSIGIASHGLLEIPGLLAQDGSPPLYYLLLNVWIDVLGTEESRVRSLSLLFALLSVPAGLWAGWTLFNPRAGWIAAGLFAINPFLTMYAQEVRMYSLLAALGVVTAAAFVHGFVRRRRRFLPLFAVALAAMLYTHNWAAFFTLGALAALAPCLVAAEPADRRRLLLDALLAFGAAALLFAPWVPTLLDQARSTGAPWALIPTWHAVARGVYRLAGGQVLAVVYLVALVAAAGTLVRERRRPELVTVVTLLVLTFAALGFAFAYASVSPAWASRYLTVLLGPLLLVVAGVLAHAGAVGIAAVALTVVFTWGSPSSALLKDRSNVEDVLRRTEPRLQRGALVLSTQPEQVPTLAYYLPDDLGLTFATPLGLVRDPRVVDWRNALARLRATGPTGTLEPLLDDVRVGGQVLIVSPVTREGGWTAPWTSVVRRRSAAWRTALRRDPRFQSAGRVVAGERSTRSTVRAERYVRIAR
jgi:mannosyltransferase